MHTRGMFYLFASLFAFTQVYAQDWDWVRRFTSGCTIVGIGVDAEQNVYAAGNFTGTNYFGIYQLVATTNSNAFVVKLDPDGEVRWLLTTRGEQNNFIKSIAVRPDGAAFVAGKFAVDDANTNAFLARIDDGKFTWAQSSSDDSSVVVGTGTTLGADGSVWLLGKSNTVFVLRFTPDGQLISGVAIDPGDFDPGKIAVSSNDQVFITGRTNLFFLAALDETGRFAWSWSPLRYNYPNRINAIECTAEGDVVSTGGSDSGFATRTRVTKHSPDGAVKWDVVVQRSYDHKSISEARDLSIDTRGRIHTIGSATPSYMYSYPDAGLWFRSFSSDGTLLSQGGITCLNYSRIHSSGSAISVTPDGATYSAGRLDDDALFGTIYVFGPGGAFIARRSTSEPQLTTEQHGDNVIISWPRAAFPVILEQFDGAQWIPVDAIPQKVGLRWQVTVPTSQIIGELRLTKTAAVPPVYGPVARYCYGPSSTFLDHTNVSFITTSNFFSASFASPSDVPVTFFWSDADIGEPLQGGGYTNHYHGYHEDRNWPYRIGLPSSLCSFYLSNVSPGHHTVRVVGEANGMSATNQWHFEVLTFETAREELLNVIDALQPPARGNNAAEALRLVFRMIEKNREAAFERQYRRFCKTMERIPELDETRRNQINAAVGQVISLMRSQSGAE
jgi:hypothetical protein